MSDTELWWGYQHTDETIHVMKFDDLDEMMRVQDSTCVKRHYGPFNAIDGNHAREVIHYCVVDDELQERLRPNYMSLPYGEEGLN